MTAEQIFGLIAWLLLAYIVYFKQLKATWEKSLFVYSNAKGIAFVLAIAAPLTLVIYAIRVVFFEDWG